MTDPQQQQQQPQQGQRMKVDLTPEEIQRVRDVQKSLFYRFQLPTIACAGGLAFYLTNVGIWKAPSNRTGFGLYVPRCAGLGLIAHVVTGGVVMKKVYDELMSMDGNFSRMTKQKMEERSGFSVGFPPKTITPNSQPKVEDFQNSIVSDKNVIDSVMSPKTEPEPLPSKSLTYDDMRQRNRLYTNPPPKQQGRFPPAPPTAPESVIDSPASPNDKKNKYGDSWSKS